MFFLRGAYSLSDNDSDFDEVDCTFVALIQSAGALFFVEKLFHRQLFCSRTGRLLRPLPTMDQDSERLRM